LDSVYWPLAACGGMVNEELAAGGRLFLVPSSLFLVVAASRLSFIAHAGLASHPPWRDKKRNSRKGAKPLRIRWK